MEQENKTIHTDRNPVMPIWGSIPLYVISCVFFIGLFGILPMALFKIIPTSDSVYYKISEDFMMSASSMAAVWVCAVIFLKYIDRQPVSELGMSIKGRWKDCLAGVVFAAVLYAIGFLVSLALEVIEIESVKFDPGVLAGTLMVYFVAAALEEIMVRGYIQGRLMTKVNKFVAIIIASLIFSVMHIANANIDLFALLNLFLAGLLLGASYLYTKNLWFPICLHTAWNWIQGSILGYEVSGTQMFPSLIEQYLPEDNILNGGKFGFEGSIICTILTVIGTAIIIAYYERKNVAGN